MRPLLITALVGGLATAFLAPACGGSDDSKTTSSTTSGTGGDATSGSGGAGGGTGSCTKLTTLEQFGKANASVFAGITSPNLGGADPDYVGVVITEDPVGKATLKPVASMVTCGDTEICLLLQQDVTQDGSAAYYLAKAGTVEVKSFDGEFLIAGSLTDVVFEEVTIDDMSGDVTPVANGKCAELASFTFDIKQPVDGWTCNPAYFDETKAGAKEIYCDCNCGAVDPDCATAANAVAGCLKGQTCGAMATCEGVPSAWTCAKEDYAGGKGNGCDCGCGVPDPDCALMPAETVKGCMAGDVCTEGKCLPMGWKCDAAFYDENAAGPTDMVCDCGCGVKDPDCDDLKLASCDFCNDMGSCSTKECKDNMEIDPMNNAVCK